MTKEAASSNAALVTTPYDIGLAILQASAAWSAFAGWRSAGGLLATATALSFALRLQVVVSAGSHTSDNRWFVGMPQNPDTGTTMEAVLISSLWLLLFAFAAAVVQVAGIRAWPGRRPQPGHPPVRPAGSAGTVGALILGAITLCYLGWIVYALVEMPGSSLGALFLGHGLLLAFLAVAPGWFWLTAIPLCSIGALLAGTRRVSARGFSLGLAMLLLPASLSSLASMLVTGTLFHLESGAEGGALLGRVLTLLELFGSITILVLMGRRGEPVAPAGMPGMGVPGMGVPGWGFRGWGLLAWERRTVRRHPVIRPPGPPDTDTRLPAASRLRRAVAGRSPRRRCPRWLRRPHRRRPRAASARRPRSTVRQEGRAQIRTAEAVRVDPYGGSGA
ncbi:hypothetical protein [Streptomyces sp. MST-110588]|uniref:hypothetical protein n=1 Tax=Streptomyces sp. MST-110588 TaxID=2833628 RepID=UPI001F5D77F3|nr:hypothetical protein [Streptomyces sp. MST-110588]UNO39642.1 hypothetical protein KGS77_08560 [Streptomyces sp. MST-110588]